MNTTYIIIGAIILIAIVIFIFTNTEGVNIIPSGCGWSQQGIQGDVSMMRIRVWKPGYDHLVAIWFWSVLGNGKTLTTQLVNNYDGMRNSLNLWLNDGYITQHQHDCGNYQIKRLERGEDLGYL